jgi:two-component system, NarL family, sensor kinase
MAPRFIYTKPSIRILCGLIWFLDILIPIEYTVGYLYILPILLAACELGINGISTVKRTIYTSIITKVGIFLTLFDLINIEFFAIVGLNNVRLSITIIVNRLSVAIVLWLTNWLIRRNLNYLEEVYQKRAEIIRYQAELSKQLQLDRIHEDFVYTLTHDLKTPLLGAIETIKYFQQAQFGSISALQSNVLSKMYRSQKRSLQLVETLLDVYRNDIEGLVLQTESIDLESIAKESIDIVVVLGLERQITLNLKCDESMAQQPKLMGDPLQLSRVFSNLLSNAIYHSTRGGQIDVLIHYRDRQYVVGVLDRGMGIALADLPFIFDRFYQAQYRWKGSGLGLHLSRQIVEAHGGTIWAESVLPQGTKFCFSLPIKI